MHEEESLHLDPSIQLQRFPAARWLAACSRNTSRNRGSGSHSGDDPARLKLHVNIHAAEARTTAHKHNISADAVSRVRFARIFFSSDTSSRTTLLPSHHHWIGRPRKGPTHSTLSVNGENVSTAARTVESKRFGSSCKASRLAWAQRALHVCR